VAVCSPRAAVSLDPDERLLLPGRQDLHLQLPPRFEGRAMTRVRGAEEAVEALPIVAVHEHHLLLCPPVRWLHCIALRAMVDVLQVSSAGIIRELATT
jgi:hypothetical protein